MCGYIINRWSLAVEKLFHNSQTLVPQQRQECHFIMTINSLRSCPCAVRVVAPALVSFSQAGIYEIYQAKMSLGGGTTGAGYFTHSVQEVKHA